MKLRKADISTWSKTADIVYASDDYKRTQEALDLELKFYKRDYNTARLEGRMRRLYARALIKDKALIKGIRAAKLKDMNYIMGTETLLRAYIKFKKEMTLLQLYGLLKYEWVNKNRFSMKQTIAAQIVKEPNFGIRKDN